MLSPTEIYAIAKEVVKHLPVQDEVLMADGVAEMMGKTREAVVKDAQRGLIPAHRRGNKWFFSKNEIVKFLTCDELCG